MTMHAAPTRDDALQRDIAILSTLAQIHYATVPQLHALCFPYHTVATARLTLYYLAEAHFIARSTWRLKRENRERGQVWTLTSKGHDLLRRYLPHVPPLPKIDLARPSTALEHEEWRVRLQLRSLLVRLLLDARRGAVLCCLEVQFPGHVGWPTAWGHTAAPVPDALIFVVWHPAEQQPADWLPWLAPSVLPTDALCYPIYVERTHAQTSVAELLPVWAEIWPTPLHIPVVIFQDQERYGATLQHLATLPHLPALRLATWAALEGDLAQDQWRDEHGRPAGLLPVPATPVA